MGAKGRQAAKTHSLLPARVMLTFSLPLLGRADEVIE
jgi:hypothetical protein